MLSCEYNPALDGASGEKLLGLETENQTRVDISGIQHDPSVITKVKEAEETPEEEDQPQSRPPNIENKPVGLLDWDELV